MPTLATPGDSNNNTVLVKEIGGEILFLKDENVFREVCIYIYILLMLINWFLFFFFAMEHIKTTTTIIIIIRYLLFSHHFTQTHIFQLTFKDT
jgi:multidrug transporter EmrE-like cation transporter